MQHLFEPLYRGEGFPGWQFPLFRLKCCLAKFKFIKNWPYPNWQKDVQNARKSAIIWQGSWSLILNIFTGYKSRMHFFYKEIYIPRGKTRPTNEKLFRPHSNMSSVWRRKAMLILKIVKIVLVCPSTRISFMPMHFLYIFWPKCLIFTKKETTKKLFGPKKGKI